MPVHMWKGKGGFHAALFFILFLVAVLGVGESLQTPLFLLRGGALLGAIVHLWNRRRNGAIEISPYGFLVGGFVLLAVGHAFSSTYVWVSFQHAINILTAAIVLSWAWSLFRKDAEGAWRIGCFLILAVAGIEVLISLYQHLYTGHLRPHGTFDTPNFLAEFLMVAALLTMARILFREESRTIRILLASGGLILLCSAMSLAQSRGVLLSATLSVAFLLIARFGWKKGALLSAGAGIPILTVLGYHSVSRFFEPDIYNYSRLIIWKSALRTFREHPLGVGLGGFKYFWYATQEPVQAAFRKYGKFATTAHNEFLEVLTGLGIVGLVLFLAILLIPLLSAARRWETIPRDRREIAAAGIAGLVLSGAHAAFDFNLHEFGIVFVDAMLLGAILACIPGGSPERVRRTVPPWWCWGGMLLLLIPLLCSTCTYIGAVAYDRGEKALQGNDRSRAEALFRAAATADPFRAPYADGLSALAYREYRSERGRSPLHASDAAARFLDEAIGYQARAVSLNPRETKYLLRLSFLFAERYRMRDDSADWDSAMLSASRLLEVHPYSAEGFLHRAKLLSSAGRVEEAAHDLEQAVSYEPNFCLGYATLAKMFKEQDPVRSERWEDQAEACRTRAAGRVLEDTEKWLVGEPEH